MIEEDASLSKDMESYRMDTRITVDGEGLLRGVGRGAGSATLVQAKWVVRSSSSGVGRYLGLSNALAARLKGGSSVGRATRSVSVRSVSAGRSETVSVVSMARARAADCGQLKPSLALQRAYSSAPYAPNGHRAVGMEGLADGGVSVSG